MPLQNLIHSKATELGFDHIGITHAEPIPEAEQRFNHWLAQGYQGQMSYLANNSKRRQDPREVLPGAKSIIVVAMNYNPTVEAGLKPAPINHGRIARYAWGRDYHKILDKKLNQLESFLHEIAPEPIQTKRYVDTGPILEKAYAERAGIGFIGKNTLLISRGLGSWLFLGEILTTMELEPTYPQGREGKHALSEVEVGEGVGIFLGSCGNCTRCLDACPTDAFTSPYQLDARKCIAYLTIEHKGSIPKELHEKMGDWIFGCDVCQEVCPYNRSAPQTKESAFHAEAGVGHTLPLDEVLAIQSDEEYLRRFQGTSLMRAKRAGLQRNVRTDAKDQILSNSPLSLKGRIQ